MPKSDGSLSEVGIAKAKPDACGLEFQSQRASGARLLTSDRSKAHKIGRPVLFNSVQFEALNMSSVSASDPGGNEEKTDG